MSTRRDTEVSDPTLPRPPGDAEILAVGTRLGRYLVTGTLGAGGQSYVLAAYDPQLDRRVAVKVLRGDAGGEERLLREAHALARVTHPNVAVVHDAGVVGGRVYLVQEYLDGGTIADWLLAARRSWREVVALFLRAGAGLRAAHDAGLVHRDFKPANVLLGRDGRLRVVDFGLARVVGAPPEEVADITPAPALAPASGPSSHELTQAGTVLGTPGYMAPEQRRGEPASARSDQYSFCVALHEALFGQRPEGGVSSRPGVPGFLRRALARGLAEDPDDRFPTMTGLLEAMARDPGRLMRRTAAGVALVAALTATVVMAAGGDDDRARCRATASLWRPGQRAAVEAAFLATGMPYAADVFRESAQVLDRFGADVGQMSEAACVATRRGQQSAELLDRRMTCLARRRDEATELITLLERADAKAAARSVQAVRSLTPVASCGDLLALLAKVAPPAPAMAATVAGIHRVVDRAQALQLVGQLRPADATAALAVAGSRAASYPPLVAETLAREAAIRDELAEYHAAQADAEEAAATAYAAGDDALAARAFTLEVKLVGLEDRPAALRLAPLARAAIARAGSSVMLAAQLENSLGIAADVARVSDDALAHAWRVKTLFESAGASPFELGKAENNLGLYLDHAGRYADGVPHLERAIALYERVLGRSHPRVADTLLNYARGLEDMGRPIEAEAAARRVLDIYARTDASPGMRTLASDRLAWALSMQGRFDEAVAAYDESVAESIAAYGEEDWRTLYARLARGYVFRSLGRYEDAAAEASRAAAVWEKEADANPQRLAYALRELGKTRVDEGRPEEALALLERALALSERSGDMDVLERAEILSTLGSARRRLRRFPEARAALTSSLSVLEAAVGASSKDLVTPLLEMGMLDLDEGAPEKARPLLERALSLCPTAEVVPRAEVIEQLARCLARVGERARALALAREAAATYRAAKLPLRTASVERWLASVK